MVPTKNYYRIMPGPKSIYAKECLDGGYIGGDWGISQDLSGALPEDWREFNRQFIPVFISNNPDKSKVAAGLACGMLHTISKGMQRGDVILTPNGSGTYYVGEVASDYYFADGPLPHRRKIEWRDKGISRDEMPESLRNSAGSIGTVSNITKHAATIERLLQGEQTLRLIHEDEAVEDPTVFALEKHLEEFLVSNWEATSLGKAFDIYSEDGEMVGQQFRSDTGPIDILAISKDKKTLLVVELKRGRASDVVVGQIQRYMGYVKHELAEHDQDVKGVIIALDEDIKLTRALSVASNIEFYKYKVDFKLIGS
ncbi:MAG: endonuclease NucS [Gammaproteobacteria bacterium]|nr:endonuclease NucS [Gammaproteobacteria bacterium]